MAEEVDVAAHPEGRRQPFQLRAAGSVANDSEAQLRMRVDQRRGGGEKRLVTLLGTQVRDRDDRAHRTAVLTRDE